MAAPRSASKRPNFLMIVTDQQRADYLGCAGHPILKTPHIDGIAARGVRFDRFYVANPVCMPNRATLMTGRMPSLHGVRHNGIPLSLSENTFVDLMRHEGYRTGLIGKSHLQNMTDNLPEMERRTEPRDDAFAEARKPAPVAGDAYEEERPWTWKDDPDHEIATPFYGFEDISLATMHSDKVGAAYIAWMKARGGDPDTMVGPENSLPHDYVAPQGWRTAVPEELYPTSYVAEETMDWLESYAGEDGGRPFLLTASFPDPHHPFTPPGKYWDMYDPADFDLPESFHRLSNQAPPTLQWMWENRPPGDGSRNAGQVAYTVTEREARESMALTCGMITMIDDAVGRILARLEALGLADNTVVVFTADHGDFLGDHRVMLKGPMHYGGLVKVPFLWAEPDGANGGAACSALAGTVDIARTMLSRAGITPYNGIQGRSLEPEIATLEDHGGGAVLIEDDQQRTIMGFEGDFRVHSLITRRWRLSVYSGAGHCELYDLENDPHELSNLYDDPSHAAIKAEMLERLAKAEIDTVDRSPFPTAIA